MELGKGNSRPLIAGLATGALFGVICVAACAPPPERIPSPKAEVKSEKTAAAHIRPASLPVPITIRVPKASQSAAQAGARGALARRVTQPAERPAYRPMKLTQLKSLDDVITETYSSHTSPAPAGEVTQLPRDPEKLAVPAPPERADAAKSEPRSSLRHPEPALPIPDNALLDAGRSAIDKHYGDRPEPVSQELLDKTARAQLNLPNDEALQAQSKQRSVVLEASFMALVLLCIVGAMWYRMSTNFGAHRPRRYDMDK